MNNGCPCSLLKSTALSLTLLVLGLVLDIKSNAKREEEKWFLGEMDGEPQQELRRHRGTEGRALLQIFSTTKMTKRQQGLQHLC